MIVKHIVWIMCLWLLASCSESREEAMLRLVNEWKDKSVIIPVCFEEDDYINRLNRFPSDMTFQTMLLNKENKVVAIGSPVLNPKIKDLYLEIITGKKRVGADKSVTTVSMDQSEKTLETSL